MKFRCKANGVILDFEEMDVPDMLRHTGYEPVDEEEAIKAAADNLFRGENKPAQKKVAKKRGRPKKVA